MTSRPKRRRYANGPRRPQYLAAADADRAVMMILGLAAEVSALRERLDTHERLASAGKPATPAAVEAYQPGPDVESSRSAARRAMIECLTRVLLEPEAQRRTGAAPPEPPALPDSTAAPRPQD